MNGSNPEHSTSPTGRRSRFPSTLTVGQYLGFGSFIYELLTNSHNADLIVASVSFGLGAKVVEEIRERLK